jgi:condensin complex subunit 1
MHGGTLNLPEWQERYDQISVELEKIDASELEDAKRNLGVQDEEDEAEGTAEKGVDVGNDDEAAQPGDGSQGEDGDDSAGSQSRPRKKSRPSQFEATPDAKTVLDPELVQRLRLTKKYYADCLQFQHQLERATPLLCTLLVSTTKSEVLESIRYFRTAYEYNVQGADIGIKKMLHLIWTKDINAPTTQNPGEGEQVDERSVKGQLIETYRSLYFDAVEGLAGKQQVSRIAKNMIE